MISKSQFVIFSALLAYQGMVGAGGSEQVAAAQASAPAPKAPAASAKTPAAPKPETYEEKKKRLTADFRSAELQFLVAQADYNKKNKEVQDLKRIIAEGKAADKLTIGEMMLRDIKMAKAAYEEAKADFAKANAELDRMADGAEEFLSTPPTAKAAAPATAEAAAPATAKAAAPATAEAAAPATAEAAAPATAEVSAITGKFLRSWKTSIGSEKMAVENYLEQMENQLERREKELADLKSAYEDAVARFERSPPENLNELLTAHEVAQLKRDAAQAEHDLPRAKKALAQFQALLKFTKELADTARAELEKAIADKTIADENKKRADQDAADAKKKADADKNKKAAVAQGATPVVPAADNKTKAEEEPKLKAEEEAKKLAPSAAAPAPVTTIPEFKALEKEVKAKVVEALVKVVLGDKPDAKKKADMEKELNTFLDFPARAAKLMEYLKKLAAESAPAGTKGKKLRRLANDDKKDGKKETKPKEADPMVQVIGQTAGEALISLTQLQQTHGDKLQNVKDQTTYAAFKADAKKTGDAISKAEALIKLREDNTAKADDLKKAKATVLGLGLGLGLGIPVLAAVVFTVLVKTNRVLLNFGSSATVSADV